MISRPVASLCYPRGRFTERIERIARATGYGRACSTLRGTLHSLEERYCLKRIRASQERKGLKLWYTTTGLYDLLNQRRAQREIARFALEEKGEA